jgi:AraC-like DNA-binding protein
MTPETFTTHDLPRHQQYDAWRGWFGSVFDTTLSGSPDDGFPAKSEVWNLDGFVFSRVSAPSVRVTRSKTLIRREPVDHWAITIGRRAATRFSSDNDASEAPAGIPFVVSLGHEMVSERDHDERLQLYLQRDHFRDLAPTLDAARGTALQTPMGQIFADYLNVLERNLPDLPAEDASRLGGAIAAMVGACVAPSPEQIALAARQLDCGRLERVRRAVRRYLRSPALGPDFLCRAVGTSRSQLYRLMEAEGGVSRYIQRQRLLESHAILCDPANSKSRNFVLQMHRGSAGRSGRSLD